MAFIADRLKAARMMNAISLQGLADRLQELNHPITKQGLSKYDNGVSVPDQGMTIALSNALGVRPDYFHAVTEITFGDIEFRKLKSYPVKEKQRIVEITRDQLRRYLELEEILSLGTRFVNPLADVEIDGLESIDRAADKLRQAWDLGTNPIPNAIELLEDHHVKVIEIESSVKLDGFSTYANGSYPVVVLNRTKLDDYADRKRWTALHELGHIVLNIEHVEEKLRERYCHYFAGALLFPKKQIMAELGKARTKLSFTELKALKKEYGLSMQAIVYRAKDLEIISESYFRQFFFMFNQLGYKKEEPVKYEGYEKSNRFQQLLFKALSEEVISMSKAAYLNNQKLADFRAEHLIV